MMWEQSVREDNEHLGFGSGIHHCYGAPLARLVQDPPPYRQSATLRGPRHLPVEVDGVRD